VSLSITTTAHCEIKFPPLKHFEEGCSDANFDFDPNGLLSGGAQPGKWSWNSALIIGANLDAEELLNWKGASFGVQFLQFNGQETNGQAGSVQGYNSLPGHQPLNRSELYQLWYRQTLFEDKIIFRIGKMVPTYDFNNVARARDLG
jgi:porin